MIVVDAPRHLRTADHPWSGGPHWPVCELTAMYEQVVDVMTAILGGRDPRRATPPVSIDGSCS
ncbi:hypothetical protein [Actinoplanes xinjiangensis]|uniref:hypothetical protein n=1 Tax=Actinoplanes xinjiangensis TaxID=512350 RepID=UPI003419CF8C